MENLGTSLWITLIGMGLVFIAIILLWGLMALLVRITQDKPEPEISTPEIIKPNLDLKAKVAAVAVAAALAASSNPSTQGQFQPPSDSVSAWQSANRSNPA